MVTSGSPNLLIRGSAPEVAARLGDGLFDLVYLDPPFGTGTTRRFLRGRGGRFDAGSPGQPSGGRSGSARSGAPAFHDPSEVPKWLGPTLVQVHRLLRPGGALFLHADHRQSHRVRLLLEELFGAENFLNEIIWHYATGGIPRQWFARKHDTILYFRRGPGHTFHRLTQKKYLAHRMCRKGVEEFRDDGGWYRYRGLDDVWEIPWLTQDSRERTGYPTQKPVALLERILLAASNPGDLVGDFCCGSGTTAVAACRTRRRWVVADESDLAVEVTRRRLDALGERTGSLLGADEHGSYVVQDWR